MAETSSGQTTRLPLVQKRIVLKERMVCATGPCEMCSVKCTRAGRPSRSLDPSWAHENSIGHSMWISRGPSISAHAAMLWLGPDLRNIWSHFKEALSINAFRACVYIYIRQFSSFRVSTLWFIDLTVNLLAIFNALWSAHHHHPDHHPNQQHHNHHHNHHHHHHHPKKLGKTNIYNKNKQTNKQANKGI